jgi:hypothetical protein
MSLKNTLSTLNPMISKTSNAWFTSISTGTVMSSKFVCNSYSMLMDSVLNTYVDYRHMSMLVDTMTYL